jgi:hypothetical protein
MGHSLLTQFDGLEFRQVTLPFISSVDKAEEAVRKINATAVADGARPVVFSTLVKGDLRSVVKRSNGLFLDFFDAFLTPLEAELEVKSSEREGRAHGIADQLVYSTRIEATNFALAADDGGVTADYQRADVILVGVSRSGASTDHWQARHCSHHLHRGGLRASSCRDDPPVHWQALRLTIALQRLQASAGAVRQPLRLAGAVRVRGALCGSAVQALHRPVPGHDRVLDRGDREPGDRSYGNRAAAAPVIPARAVPRVTDAPDPCAIFGR